MDPTTWLNDTSLFCFLYEGPHKLSERAIVRDELLVGPGFRNPTIRDHEDAVHMRQIGQAMRH